MQWPNAAICNLRKVRLKYQHMFLPVTLVFKKPKDHEISYIYRAQVGDVIGSCV